MTSLGFLCLLTIAPTKAKLLLDNGDSRSALHSSPLFTGSLASVLDRRIRYVSRRKKFHETHLGASMCTVPQTNIHVKDIGE